MKVLALLYWAYFRRWLWLICRLRCLRYVECDLAEVHLYSIGVMHVRELKKSVWDRRMIILYRVSRI